MQVLRRVETHSARGLLGRLWHADKVGRSVCVCVCARVGVHARSLAQCWWMHIFARIPRSLFGLAPALGNQRSCALRWTTITGPAPSVQGHHRPVHQPPPLDLKRVYAEWSEYVKRLRRRCACPEFPSCQASHGNCWHIWPLRLAALMHARMIIVVARPGNRAVLSHCLFMPP